MNASFPHRVLVLGAAGFFGTACVKTLLDRNVRVTTLDCNYADDGEFARAKLSANVIGLAGLVQDADRLRQTIAIHEIDLVVQCAVAETAAATNALTRAAIAAVAASERKPVLAVPLRAGQSSILRFHSPDEDLKVSFVNLPLLFGVGDDATNRWPAMLFVRAALEEQILPPSQERGVCEVHLAANQFLDFAGDPNAQFNGSGRWGDVPAQATGRELFRAVKDELGPRLYGESSLLQDQVRTTLEWYRSQAKRWRMETTAPALRVAA